MRNCLWFFWLCLILAPGMQASVPVFFAFNFCFWFMVLLSLILWLTVFCFCADKHFFWFFVLCKTFFDIPFYKAFLHQGYALKYLFHFTRYLYAWFFSFFSLCDLHVSSWPVLFICEPWKDRLLIGFSFCDYRISQLFLFFNMEYCTISQICNYIKYRFPLQKDISCWQRAFQFAMINMLGGCMAAHTAFTGPDKRNDPWLNLGASAKGHFCSVLISNIVG